MTTDEFRQAIEAFLVRHEMKPTTFGIKSCNDSAFVFRIRNGRNPSLKKVNQILEWMKEHDRESCGVAA